MYFFDTILGGIFDTVKFAVLGIVGFVVLAIIIYVLVRVGSVAVMKTINEHRAKGERK